MLIAICDDDKRICSILNLFGVIAFFAVMTVIHSYQQVKKAREESLQNALVSKQVEELSGHIYTMEKLYSDIRGIRYTLRYGFEPSRTAAYALRAYPELTLEEVREATGNFYKRFFSQQFKRSCLPDGPKVGSVSLSPRGDWRMPSDASVKLWLKDLAS